VTQEAVSEIVEAEVNEVVSEKVETIIQEKIEAGELTVSAEAIKYDTWD
jgi:anti-sigma28 factor (negative regulator of flagellin synthesis)